MFQRLLFYIHPNRDFLHPFHSDFVFLLHLDFHTKVYLFIYLFAFKTTGQYNCHWKNRYFFFTVQRSCVCELVCRTVKCKYTAQTLLHTLGRIFTVPIKIKLAQPIFTPRKVSYHKSPLIHVVDYCAFSFLLRQNWAYYLLQKCWRHLSFALKDWSFKITQALTRQREGTTCESWTTVLLNTLRCFIYEE